jgi:hydrogenase expression/formation protein HypE
MTGDRAPLLPDVSAACPVPHSPEDRILLAHGEGARLTRRLIRDVLLLAFDNEFLRPMADGAVLPLVEGRLVLTTDSSVVSPLFFPGGDIGKLAVHGAVNDLAVCGAEPLYLCLALILEEGLPLETLRRVVESIREAARACRVLVVTGDTKVVSRGAVDKLFISTTGVGRLRAGVELGPHRIRPGDRVLVSGTVGDHGIAILTAREGFELESDLCSDTAPLHDLVQSLLAQGDAVRFLRDPTRGGLSAALHEVCEAAGVSVVLEESSLPLNPAVRGACEILGLDPLYVANEGKLLVITAPEVADEVLNCLRRHPLGRSAALIGEVTDDRACEVLVRGVLGSTRVLDEPSGSPLPRIC